MKLKLKPKIKAVTEVTRIPGNLVTIHHHQTIKQSKNYNSAEVGYGITFQTIDEEANIKLTIKRAEKIIEDRLAKKFHEQTGILEVVGV